MESLESLAACTATSPSILASRAEKRFSRAVHRAMRVATDLRRAMSGGEAGLVGGADWGGGRGGGGGGVAVGSGMRLERINCACVGVEGARRTSHDGRRAGLPI
ncbi:hypothetical protein Pcinc_007529 [Petrolisthes cinctipes]|uniref:Uncharacterized protein n=1 Tax=Petrolisthes cinctipes TaxID=88211 RepID=A0AAE1GAL9_PETCI|nr:hypothetical protein Pcinc_007529 [Petrolisthes cinctipes]